MKKNNKELLKKHHFWVLFVLVPLFVLIAVLMVSSSVSEAIDARQKAISKEESDIKSKTNPKPEALINKMGEVISYVNGKQDDLWKRSYVPQKMLYVIDQKLVPARVKVTDQTLAALKAEGMPEPTLKKVEGMKNKELFRGEFIAEISKALSSEERDRWRDTIVDSAKLTDWLKDKAIPLDQLGGGMVPIGAIGMKFGDTFPNDNDQYDKFKDPELYRDRYEKMAKRVAPTQFARGGWENILRFVNSWTAVKLTSNQIWLLLEDMWVQDSMLDAVSSINAQMAEFSRVKFERDGRVIDDPADASKQSKLSRKFRSRTWELELEVAKSGNDKYVLKGRLTNITDKLQLMGTRNTMILRVWLQSGDRKTLQPFEFKIGGEFVPGGGDGATRIVKVKDKNGLELERTIPTNVLEIIESTDHIIPPGLLPTPIDLAEIAAVEQVFDSRTVPVRAIEAMALGFPDSRNASIPLKLPKFFPPEDAPPAAAPGATGTAPGAMPTPGPGPGTTNKPVGGGFPGMGGQQGSARTIAGGGPVASVVDANKKRYLEVTDQVRRLPVGMVVVVDQAYLQDILLAFANSPLRFQITQVTWNRYRGSLGSDSGSSGSPSDGNSGEISVSGQGNLSSEFGAGNTRPRPGRSPSGPGPVPSAGTGPGPGMNYPGSGGVTASTVSESQLTSGLIELSVYGVVSLYSSPDSPPVDPVAKKDPKDQTAAPPVPNPQAPKDPLPKNPMPADPKSPKMRVRRKVRTRE